VPRLEVGRERLQRAEEAGADEAQLRPPEREDDEGDRDPAGAAREQPAAHPLRSQREAERRARHPGERAADEDVRVAVGRHVDPHRVGRGGRLAHRPHVEPWPGPGQVEPDRDHARPGGVDEHGLREHDRPDDRELLEAEGVDVAEVVPRRRAAELEVVAQVRREACRPRKESERQAGDDLTRTQRDRQEGVDQRHRGSGQRSDPDR
jgi:hypothetical protein